MGSYEIRGLCGSAGLMLLRSGAGGSTWSIIIPASTSCGLFPWPSRCRKHSSKPCVGGVFKSPTFPDPSNLPDRCAPLAHTRHAPAMQKSHGPKSTALRRPLRVLSGNKARRPKESVHRKHPLSAAAHPAESVRSKHPPPAAADPQESVRSKPAAAHPPESVHRKHPPTVDPEAADDLALDRLLLARSDLASIVSQVPLQTLAFRIHLVG
jgi:hypothetical protein